MERPVVLHIPHLRYDKQKFSEAIGDLNQTQYSLIPGEDNPPRVTHCISAVRYIIEKSTGFLLPRVYIGNMGNMLVENIGARLIDIEDHSFGDIALIFRKSDRMKAYMTTHVGIFSDDEGAIAHSTNGGLKFTHVNEYIKEGVVATCRQILGSRDPRSKSRS